MKIVLTGGGTGGHLVPLVAVARKIKEKNPEAQFLFIGPSGEMEKKIMSEEGIPRKTAMSGKMRRYFSFLNGIDFLKIPVGIVQSLWHLLWNMPDAIFSKGGWASIPVVLAGWVYRIPILIHESDAQPGLANSILAKFATRVAIAYPQAQNYFPVEQTVLTGNPLRSDIAQGDPEKAREAFHFSPTKKVIFVTGGSLGAQSINNKILEILPELLHTYQVIHQTGLRNYAEAVKKAGELGIKAEHDGYFPIAFIKEEMKDIFALADLVISRASASTIAEIAANGKPAILIPLPSAANDHQRMNAYAIAQVGGCVVLEENNLGENMLLKTINDLMNNEELKNKLIGNIKTFYHPDAANMIAEGILGMVK